MRGLARAPRFGKNGIVDLKLDLDQVIDLETGEIGRLNSGLKRSSS